MPARTMDGKALAAQVRAEAAEEVRALGEPVAVLCHVSHPYRDGASLYFTFFFACPNDPEEAIAHWAVLKRAATAAIVEGGGTLVTPEEWKRYPGTVGRAWTNAEIAIFDDEMKSRIFHKSCVNKVTRKLARKSRETTHIAVLRGLS